MKNLMLAAALSAASCASAAVWSVARAEVSGGLVRLGGIAVDGCSPSNVSVKVVVRMTGIAAGGSEKSASYEAALKANPGGTNCFERLVMAADAVPNSVRVGLGLTEREARANIVAAGVRIGSAEWRWTGCLSTSASPAKFASFSPEKAVLEFDPALGVPEVLGSADMKSWHPAEPGDRFFKAVQKGGL